MSGAVSVLIFMEDYTFDLNPIDHKALHNQNNMCISKPIAAWEAGGSSLFFFLVPDFGIFSGKILSSAH